MATYAGRYDEVLLRKAGNRVAPAAANTTVLVYESDGTTAATLYTDRTKATTADNPVDVDSSGNLEFFAEPDTYVIAISEDGTQVATDTVTVPADPVEALFGDGASTASALSITDAGGHYAATDVEAALQEVPTLIGNATSDLLAEEEVLFTGDRMGLLGATPSIRIPLAANPEIDGPTAVADGTSQNLVGFNASPKVSGDFTDITGSDAGHWWGSNVFAIMDTDARGVSSPTGSLVELAVMQDGGSINTARGLESGVSFYGAAAGAAVTQMESMRVTAPMRKADATGGTVTNAYGLFVEQVSGFATDSNFSLFVAGGVSRFEGRVDFGSNIAYSGAGDRISLFGGFSGADGARLDLIKNASGGHLVARMANPGASFQVHSDAAITFSVSRTGLPKWDAAANQQTTVGAAGAASALPAAPTKYLKVVDSAGTELVIPAYAAA